ncbi:MAG: hypothetical protein H0V54_06520, partial [Chthoniobacterales bacterium]|nr:hypothetical protein [Chthoniobacterales bacterium]
MKMFLILAVLFVSLGAQVHAADEINTGKQPEAGLVQGDDIEADDDIPAKRAFYGTTSGGGSTGNGTIFQVTDSGEVTTLVNFAGLSEPKGSSPVAILIRGSDGDFYGTTYSGGASNLGTVFKVTDAGALTTLAEFTGGISGIARGANPTTALLEDPAFSGTFYGTTTHGGV